MRTNRTSDYRIGLQAALGFCFDELETEKRQIIEAFDSGLGCLSEGEQYFNEQFKQD